MIQPPRWDETIALFGGRFDPPHLGHREAVRGLFITPGLKQVWILPSPTPPHKPAVAPVEDRVEMARLCFEGLPVKLDLRELDRARRSAGPTYTFDTLSEIRHEAMNIAFVIGADQLRLLPTWYRFPELLQLSHWIVLARKPDGDQSASLTLREWEASGLIEKTRQDRTWAIRQGKSFLTVQPTEAPAMSSTEIREAIARMGKPPEKNLSPEVWQYLKQKRLYGSVSHLNDGF